MAASSWFPLPEVSYQSDTEVVVIGSKTTYNTYRWRGVHPTAYLQTTFSINIMARTKTTYTALKDVYVASLDRGRGGYIRKGTAIDAKRWAALKPSQQAHFAAATVATGKARLGGTARELPVIDGVVKTHFAPSEFHLLPVEVHHVVNEIAPLWEAETGLPFPGINVNTYSGDKHLTWWITGSYLPGTATPMWSSTNHLTQWLPKYRRPAGGYQFRTAALLQVRDRLLGGRPVFATPAEALDRVLA